MLQVFGQFGNIVHILTGLGGQAQKEVEAELGEAGGVQGQDGLLQVGFGQMFIDDPA